VQIVSVARSTARLSRGTQRVEAGDLAHRIPVRRRDQLGDLAHSFNHMTASVEEMLAGVAERERLKRELELAREIQQSLLPERELRHGVLSVVTFFRPAAEVGGDYFDLFPLAEGRLLVTVGDVAGHGLSTGLLMAMVKSAAATLVAEGHRGADLLQRLNRLMLEQPREHRMVTFAAVDLDPAAGTAEVTSAGHPPAVRLSPGGEVEEVMLPALPAGTRWRRPPPTKLLPFPPGCRLVLYSDGLTEALSGTGEPFGYPRLLAFLRSAAALPSGQLLEALLAELERFTAGSPQGDDQTLLVLEHQAAPAAE
jgi:sigma-B regulation protein RsbU (phosphoserine phosphatase)